MKPETKYKGSIKLSAIGDALGWMTEFETNAQSLKEKFGYDNDHKIPKLHKIVLNMGVGEACHNSKIAETIEKVA